MKKRLKTKLALKVAILSLIAEIDELLLVTSKQLKGKKKKCQ